MLNKGLNYSEELKLSFDCYDRNSKIIRRLFDDIRNGKELNELGLKITRRVLKLFLPEDQYAVNVNGYGGQTTINVVKNNNKYSQAAEAFALASTNINIADKNSKYNQLEKLLKQLCIDNFKDGLPNEVGDFKTKLNSIDIDIKNIIKCMNEMGMSLDKNDIVEMLSDILYQIEPLDMEHPKKSETLKLNREVFACPNQWDDVMLLSPLNVIREDIPRWLKKKLI